MSSRATPSGSTPARPLRADAERNRQRIIAAAREVFAERGVEVTLDDIARHAGVGVGTVYRRFADREELIEAVFEDQVERLAAAAEEATRCQDPWTGLEQLLTVAGQYFADNRGLRTILLEGGSDRPRTVGMRERLTPAVTAVLTRAQQAGTLRADIEATDVPLIHIMLMAAAEQGRAVTPDLWKRYLTLILDGLRQDRDRPTPLPQRALDQGEFDRAMR
ncbi:TetR/AcrR family transcriptional regulator [Streptomyces sp. NPDC051684]|uniref:TetR/AcrR family transcriptional regulator n=1 Tax=Streptomyces sp. NPDC051684 TaxID=3365670 RepID=UPI00378F7356